MTDYRVGLNPAQSALVEASAPFVLMVAGKGSGKTFALFAKMLHLIKKNPGISGLFVMPTNGMLEDVAIPTYSALLESYQIPHYWKKPSGRSNLYVHMWGVWTEIRFRSAEVPARLEGPEYAWLLMDEAGQISDEAFSKAMSRVRAKGTGLLQKVAVGTPEGMSGPFYEHAEGDYNAESQPLLIRARTMDNRHLVPSPEQYIKENFGYLPTWTRDQYVNGLFVPPTGRVYSHFDPRRHEAELARPTQDERLVMMCDFNIGRMVWPIGRIVVVRGGERLEICGEVHGVDKDTFDQAEEAAHVWGDLLGMSARQAANLVQPYVDAAGKARSRTGASDHQALRHAGFRPPKFKPGNPRVKDRVSSLQKLLHDKLPDGSPRFLVDPQKAPETCKAIKNQAYNKAGDPDKSKGEDAVTDGIGYLTHIVWPSHRPSGNDRIYEISHYA